MTIVKDIICVGAGVATGLNGIISAGFILDYISTRSEIIGAELAKHPVITEQVYQNAEQLANLADKSDLTWAIVNGSLAGGCLAATMSMSNYIRGK
ncbi:hypothetical protein ACFL1H_03720 [Nanoarchaeota archaeon]